MSGVRKKRWKGPLPVSAVNTVLLKDNRFADLLLDDRLRQIGVDRGRAKNLLDWQHQSFVLNQAIKETELREMRVDHTSFLPEVTMRVTHPAVRARRPFGKVRRSASEMMGELALFEKRLSLPALAPRTRSLTLPEISISSKNAGNRTLSGNSEKTRRTTDSTKVADSKDSDSQGQSYTHLHGIGLEVRKKSKTSLDLKRKKHNFSSPEKRLCGSNLPLYGPEAEAEREEKEKRHVRALQRRMCEMNINCDDRFVRLEKSLIRESSGKGQAGKGKGMDGHSVKDDTEFVEEAGDVSEEDESDSEEDEDDDDDDDDNDDDTGAEKSTYTSLY